MVLFLYVNIYLVTGKRAFLIIYLYSEKTGLDRIKLQREI
ncbi:hypothetical protein LD85_2143 [Saccharolobus islandicus L.D.8.5]|uniref:Uncharacterized protein n=1 Tax=Saccharolobus islandicus (strain L.D.8.5 / Lassen \|nr:hypothetical protein LD85_2143 [Sulfolobus islandicus L.D.8.5]